MSTYSFLYSAYNVACEILTGFAHCGLGKRLTKTGTTDTTSYVYDGMYAVCEFDGTEKLKATYVYANGLLLGKREVTPGGIITHYYHHDALGSTMLLTDETGVVAQAYLYDEFGNLLQSWRGVDNHYLYTGQEWDTEIAGTELYNLRARYYDTGIGRFASEAPELQSGPMDFWTCACSPTRLSTAALLPHLFRNPQSLNAYPYVTNNPTNYVDPWGLFKFRGPGCCVEITYDEARVKECLDYLGIGFEHSWKWCALSCAYCIACPQATAPCVLCAGCLIGFPAGVLVCLASGVDIQILRCCEQTKSH